MNMNLGIESSNGSLGQGLSMAVGIAEAAKRQRKSYKTYTLIGDGEANEGSIWEATMLAAHLKLDNLTMLVDYNRMQNDGAAEDILLVENLAERFDVFGWHVIEIDGHNISEILEAFEEPHSNQKPKAIVANTLKGKGVKFMEGQKDWNHNRITQKTYELAMEDLKLAYPTGKITMEINARNVRQWARLGPRGFFGQAILSIADDYDDLIVMSADLGSSSGLERFRISYPEKFLNTGIAEQNLIGVAAGLAKEGHNVFATSFSPFIAMRASDQVRMNMGI